MADTELGTPLHRADKVASTAERQDFVGASPVPQAANAATQNANAPPIALDETFLFVPGITVDHSLRE